LAIRLADDELTQLRALASASRISVSEYLRRRGLRDERHQEATDAANP
jgi:hypothetical protein